MPRVYLGLSPMGPAVLRNLRTGPTGEPLLLLDEGEATKLAIDFADWLETGETISSVTVAPENCAASSSLASPTLTLTISNATSPSFGRVTVNATTSTSQVIRQRLDVRRRARYTDEQTYRDYT